MEKQLPKDWNWSKIGKICEKPQYGWTTKGVNTGKIHLLRTTDITSGSIKWADVPYCEKEPEDLKKYLLKDGDIVISRAGSVGYSYLLNNPPEAVFASYLIRFKPKSVSKHYVYYFLQSPEYWNAISEKKLGIAIPNVNATKLSDIDIPIPPSQTQEKIVQKIEELFTQLDAGVAELQEAKIRLERYRQSVLKAAVTGELTREWREAHQDQLEPAEQLLERILAERRAKWEEEEWAKLVERAKKKVAQRERKAAGLPYYFRDMEPEDWEHVEQEDYQQYLPENEKWKEKYNDPTICSDNELDELPRSWCWVSVDQVTNLSQYGTSEKANLDPSGVPVLRMGNIRSGRLDYDDLKYMPDDWQDLEKYLLYPGDILFNRTNSAELVGKTAVYESNHPKSVFASYLVRLRISNLVIPDYLACFINSSLGKNYIYSVVTQQVGQANVNATKLSKMCFPLPSFSEQNIIISKLEKRLSIIDDIGNTLALEQLRIGRLRQSILKQAFEGKLINE